MIRTRRFLALGFLKGQPFIETPNLDALARRGVHLKNAFVTTALCSPSRASILTGQYAHQHRVVDNYNPVSPDLEFFPQSLQAAGYETAFVAKWHTRPDDPGRGGPPCTGADGRPQPAARSSAPAVRRRRAFRRS